MKNWFKIIWVGLSILIVINMANSAFRGEYNTIKNQNKLLIEENKNLKYRDNILVKLLELKKSQRT